MDWDCVLAALRDFFAARDGRAMMAACAALAQADPVSAAAMPDAAATDDLECAFNRLFVGPGVVAAPPYASVYLDSDCRLMGDATRRAAAIYDAIGLASPRPGSLPDDHLSLELDAVLAFRAVAARGHTAESAALWRYFLRDHIALWLPAFAAAVGRTEDVPTAIEHMVALLSAWLAEETEDDSSADEQPRGEACAQ